jgi:tetratricopeptide (TPR) repeat protein
VQLIWSPFQVTVTSLSPPAGSRLGRRRLRAREAGDERRQEAELVERGNRRSALGMAEDNSFHLSPQVDPGTPAPSSRDGPAAQRGAQRRPHVLEKALALNPRLAGAHNTLGVIAAQSGQADAAIEPWKEALALEPREYDTVYNIGRVLWNEGRTDEARPYLERFVREAPAVTYGKDIALVRAWLSGR